MEVFAKVTAAVTLLPLIGSGLALPTAAQPIVPTHATTQVTVLENGSIDIRGGNQSASNLFHSFDQFNLEQRQTANFLTSPTTDTIVGQIIGGTVSNIDGLLQVTGSQADLYLINPAGLIFGPNARLDLGGSFTATTATHIGSHDQWFDILSDPDYSTLVTLPSRVGFRYPATIVNQGQLTVRDGQSLRLIAPHINNSGTLRAPDGDVTLFAAAPGQTIHLAPAGGLLSVEVPIEPSSLDLLPALITGGDISHSSELIVDHNGEVTLVNRAPSTSPQVSSSLKSTGDISTQGLTGGAINLLGQSIQVLDGTLNATGLNGGGTIRIGGDVLGQGALPQAVQTHITAPTTLVADAINGNQGNGGNGGQVIIWSDGTTFFDGTISAQSATGNGGFVATSGLGQLTIGENATVTTHAPAGVTGLWRLNAPALSVIAPGGFEHLELESLELEGLEPGISDIASSTIHAPTLASALSDTTVALQATNTIAVNAAIDAVFNASGTGPSNALWLDTPTLNLNQRITLEGIGRLSGTANTINVGTDGSIQNAVDAAADAGTISLAATTYREGNMITLDRPVTLIGRGQNSTYISGDSDNNGIGDHPIVHVTTGGNNINLTGLTIQDGLSTLDSAGLKNDGANTVISDIQFINNEIIDGTGDGGALNNRGSLTISNAVFENNRTRSDGGAIDIVQGSVTLADSRFINNQADHNGGAVSVDPNGRLTILNTDFSQNFAGQHGGAISSQGDLHVDTAHFANNSALSQGGAVFLNADSEINASFFANSAIIGNQAATLGGGIESASRLSRLDIVNSTISGNQASTGGGIHTVSPTRLTNVTIAENIASSSGGGLSAKHSTMSVPALINPALINPELINTLVASNRAPTNPDVEGQFNDQGNNLIGSTQGSTGFSTSTLVGTAQTPLNPGLTPLNANAGSLPSHQLLSTSLAANGGNNSVATARDQQGQPRIVGGTVDIGAVESAILPTHSSRQPEVVPSVSQPQPREGPPRPQQPNAIAPPTLLSGSLNQSRRLTQEQKPIPTSNPEQDSTRVAPTHGRLRYFDDDAFRYLEDSFSQDYEDYWQLPQTRPMTLSSVQQTLYQGHGEYQSPSAVIYAVFVPQTALDDNTLDRFVLPRTQSNPSPDDQLLLILVSATDNPVQHLVNVSRAELTQQAKLFRLAVSDPEDPIGYKALARQLYGWLLAPLHPDLVEQQIDHVMYALDQGLRTIPLAAMMQDDTFIIEQYGVSLIPSMGLTQPQFGNVVSEPRPLIAGAQRFQALEDLPAVPIELDFIAHRLQTHNILLNESFTFENFLKTKTSQEISLLHLATHAEFNAGDLDQSFIQFWDSPLTFNQMKNLSWPELELLILSACDTAISSPDAELGFIGLAAAAGIETSMGSLWNVSDIGTLALMAEFYTQLPNTPLRAQALQNAQLSLLRGETYINNNTLNTSQGQTPLPQEWDLTTAAFSHPFYWSGFAMVGNPWY